MVNGDFGAGSVQDGGGGKDVVSETNVTKTNVRFLSYTTQKVFVLLQEKPDKCT